LSSVPNPRLRKVLPPLALSRWRCPNEPCRRATIGWDVLLPRN